jgi:hypothetical protein
LRSPPIRLPSAFHAIFTANSPYLPPLIWALVKWVGLVWFWCECLIDYIIIFQYLPSPSTLPPHPSPFQFLTVLLPIPHNQLPTKPKNYEREYQTLINKSKVTTIKAVESYKLYYLHLPHISPPLPSPPSLNNSPSVTAPKIEPQSAERERKKERKPQIPNPTTSQALSPQRTTPPLPSPLSPFPSKLKFSSRAENLIHPHTSQIKKSQKRKEKKENTEAMKKKKKKKKLNTSTFTFTFPRYKKRRSSSCVYL